MTTLLLVSQQEMKRMQQSVDLGWEWQRYKMSRLFFLFIVGIHLFGQIFATDQLFDAGVFTIHEGLFGGQVWRFFSAGFFHVNGNHLIGVASCFYFFAPMLEQRIGRRKMLTLLMASSVAATIFYTLLVVVHLVPDDEMRWLVGGTAMCLAMLAALFKLSGDQMIRLMFIQKPFRLKWVIVTLGLLWVLPLILQRGVIGETSQASQSSHLIGILIGVLVVIWESNKHKKVKGTKKKPKYTPKIKPRTAVKLQDGEVDKILDKISADGFQSLSAKERKTLEDAANNKDE